MTSELVEQPPPIRPFPLREHLRATRSAAAKANHVKIGLQNWLVTHLLANAGVVRPKTPARFTPPASHFGIIEREAHSLAPKDEMLRLMLRLPFQKRPKLGAIDWEAAVSEYGDLPYPDWYLVPQHSFPGGYLCPAAAVDDRVALDARYQDAHPKRSLGIRALTAELVPKSARRIFDFGTGVGDLAATIAAQIPEAEVIAVEPSPFMQIVAKRMHGDVPNLVFRHAFADQLSEPAASVDAITISLVLHEVPDAIKRALLETAHRLLKPGGTLVVCDVPSDDLDRHRGAFEPYRKQWQKFDPDAALRGAGFSDIAAHQLVSAEYQWHRAARKGTA